MIERSPMPCHLPLLAAALLFFLIGCAQKQAPTPDNPRLTPRVTMHDITFHSGALNREMQYRVIVPASIPTGPKLPVVYLLHGGGGGYRDWSNQSDVAKYAETGLILVMPEGHSSYYTNSVERTQDRYADYIVNDLIADVEARFPAASGRANRAIVGVSMGGFGAIALALKSPGRFAFVGGISSAIDVPQRPFSIRRFGQWRHHRSIFGPWQSQARRERDPFAMAGSVEPAGIPYLFLTCGEQEGLLPANRNFAALLARRHLPHEFHVVAGGHDWVQWNSQLPALFQRLLHFLGPDAVSA